MRLQERSRWPRANNPTISLSGPGAVMILAYVISQVYGLASSTVLALSLCLPTTTGGNTWPP
ncbi:hypothetical protein GY45DRAFT_1437434 [Cubamyces sp. BRFM 1775]|nr:hypothetical protein GY45DRAFT_1437434 [Cubamyces sp. BRFM 1775]